MCVCAGIVEGGRKKLIEQAGIFADLEHKDIRLYVEHDTSVDEWIRENHYLHSVPAGAIIRLCFKDRDQRVTEGEKMRIALHDRDSERLHNKTFPNYALMKIEAYHKQQGDAVGSFQTPHSLNFPSGTFIAGYTEKKTGGLTMISDVVFSSAKNDWETPQDFFDYLNAEFGFTLDPAADDRNHKCAQYYTKEQDGLSQDWNGHTVFFNPPYGRNTTGQWVEKAYSESQKPGTTVVMLIPARTDTKWFHRYIEGKAEIRFVKGRLKFGGSKDSAPFSLMVVVFRASPTEEETQEMELICLSERSG